MTAGNNQRVIDPTMHCCYCLTGILTDIGTYKFL